MADPLLMLEAVQERDIDLLLLEELAVSREFAEWLVLRTFSGLGAFQELKSVRHSVSEATRESDLEFIFKDDRGRALALLVEDKIDAPPQPNQGLRYKERVARGKEMKLWDEARTCMVAPCRYLDASSDVQNYDVSVSYEDIAEWFKERARNDARAKYREDFVRAAIEQGRRGYVVVKDAAVTAFWAKYWKDASALFPELELEEPRDRGSQATWVLFRPARLPKHRTLNHKLTIGGVDLTTEYPSSRVEELQRSWAQLLSQDTSVVATGKSASVRVLVPPLNVRADYDDQRQVAREGMRAAYRLLYLCPSLLAP